jgi:hypothetical protein
MGNRAISAGAAVALRGVVEAAHAQRGSGLDTAGGRRAAIRRAQAGHRGPGVSDGRGERVRAASRTSAAWFAEAGVWRRGGHSLRTCATPRKGASKGSPPRVKLKRRLAAGVGERQSSEMHFFSSLFRWPVGVRIDSPALETSSVATLEQAQRLHDARPLASTVLQRVCRSLHGAVGLRGAEAGD